MSKEHRFQGIHIKHPNQRDQVAGAESEIWIAIARPSGSIIEVPITESELVRLIAAASNLLSVLYKGR